MPGGGQAGAAATRDHTRHAIGPVWEANHVWLIFVLTVAWTCYPVAFGSIVSTLGIPLLIVAIGIILRGTAYALRSQFSRDEEPGVRLVEYLFALSSVLVTDSSVVPRTRAASLAANPSTRLKDRGNPGFAACSLGTRVADTTLGGYSLIRAGSLDAAVALARGCPMLDAGGAVEVCELTSHDERFDQWLDTKGGRRD